MDNDSEEIIDQDLRVWVNQAIFMHLIDGHPVDRINSEISARL